MLKNQPSNIFTHKRLKQTDNPIIASMFYLDSNQKIQVILKLTQKKLIFQQIEKIDDKRQCNLSLDISYDIIYRNDQSSINNTLIFFKNEFKLQLFPSKQKDINEWQKQLKKKICRMNFFKLFKPIKNIGNGNFADIYLAYEQNKKLNFAIKAFLKKKSFQQENGKQIIENQIKILRLLNHTNIIKLEGVYCSENSIYVAMQFIPGKNLSQKRKYSIKDRKEIFKGILCGLKEMHENNVIHRDLKPQNIMMVGLKPVIIDFGLATIGSDKEYLIGKCGTPGYIAPEIFKLKGKDVIYPISDVFSAGCIFYELISGKKLFPFTNNAQITSLNKKCDIDLDFKQLKEQVVDLHELQIILLRRMLQKYPEYRISAKQALNHQYFKNESESEHINIQMKQNAFSPIQLINGQLQISFADFVNQLQRKPKVTNSVKTSSSSS